MQGFFCAQFSESWRTCCVNIAVPATGIAGTRGSPRSHKQWPSVCQTKTHPQTLFRKSSFTLQLSDLKKIM
jgi:hypothetical protein